MKRLALIVSLVLVLAPGCKSSGGATPQPAAEKKPSPEDLKAEEARRLVETARMMAGQPPTGPSDPEAGKVETEWIIVTDEATGRKLQRIPKGPPLRAVNGKLFSGVVNRDMGGLDIVREDADYYYVAVEAPAAKELKPKTPQDEFRMTPLVAAEEYESVVPSTSRVRLRFEEHSAGLPTSGYWRSNMAVADVDGDGKPEIVTGPPRLASGPVRIFRYDGSQWSPAGSTFGGDENLNFGYGGVAVHDMDGDGRPDILAVGHGSGPIVAFSEGALRFRKDTRGLPREMSGRAIAAGDLDGDGRADILVLSDESESAELRRKQRKEEARKERVRRQGGSVEAAPEKATDGYERGLDVRAFFSGPDGQFVQNSAGLEDACWGYSLALNVSPVDRGAPFFVSGCRTLGGTTLLYEYDRAAKAFRFSGRDVVEYYSYHSGAAMLTYLGKPGAASSYVKVDASGGQQKSFRGNGVTVYYRDGAKWKRKRVVKAADAATIESAGIGTGDLNGDGLDDIVWADDAVGRVRVFFQTAKGEFEELDPALEPRYVNHSMSVQVVDVDGDGRKDIVLMYEFRSTDKTRAGGLRFFRNAE